MLQDEIMKLQTYKMFEGEDTVYINRDDVLEVLKQQPCEDCISRQAAIDLLKNMDTIVSPISDAVLLIDKAEAMTKLIFLPPAQVESDVHDINVGKINCILDKIRTEIESCREDEEPHLVDYRYYRNEGLDMALDIIDKYKAESEE